MIESLRGWTCRNCFVYDAGGRLIAACADEKTARFVKMAPDLYGAWLRVKKAKTESAAFDEALSKALKNFADVDFELELTTKGSKKS